MKLPTFTLAATAAILAVGASSAMAQQIRLSTLGVAGVFAADRIAVSQRDQPIGATGLELQAQRTSGSGFGTRIATARVLVQPKPFGVASFLFSGLQADPTSSTGSTDSVAGQRAPAIFLGVLSTPTPQVGDFVVRYIGGGTPGASTVKVLTPIGERTLVDDLQERTLRVPGVAIDANGLAFLLEFDALLQGGSLLSAASTDWAIEVSFEVARVARCVVTPDAASCSSGGSLTGTTESRGAFERVTLRAAGAPIVSDAYALISFAPQTVPLPLVGQSTGCVLLAGNPIVVPAGFVDPNGDAAYPLDVPSSFVGTAFVQLAFTPLAVLGLPFTLDTSNTVRIDCP